MSWTRRLFLALSPWLLKANQPPVADTPKFSVDVNLVTAAFTVRDSAGALIPLLTRADFNVFEEGDPQEIRLFSREEELPLTLGLILDRSPSESHFEQENIHAAITFFRRVLRPQDRAMIVAFGDRIKLICDLTADRDRLEASLKKMRKIYSEVPRVGPAIERSGGSAVVDSVYWPVVEKLKGIAGRKALIMIGDGKENSSDKTMTDAIDALQTEDTIFYGLDNGGANTAENRRLRNLMPPMAEESGGRVFDLKTVKLAEAFTEIEQELRTLYTIGYVTSHPQRDGRFRKIEIRPKEARYLVRARTGYFAR
jgi:Ca-activated chloride channel family protein